MLILIFSGGNEYKLFIVAFQVCRKLCRLEQPYFSNFLSSNVYYLAFFFSSFRSRRQGRVISLYELTCTYPPCKLDPTLLASL